MTIARKRALFLVAIAVALALAFAATLRSNDTGSSARLLHTEPSGFAPIVVFEEYGERCMNFHSIEHPGRQTCMLLSDPDRMVFEYTRMMTSALFAKPDPESILIIGLGGATLPVALHKMLPDAVIDSIEIDPAVVRVSQYYFGYKTGPRQQVFVEDGRAFVERAHQEGQQYDIVMLDAFDSDSIPAHLLTQEFLQHIHDILTPDGIVAANLLTQSVTREQESATYAAVFGDFYNLRASLGGNRVIIAARTTLPDIPTLQRRAHDLAARLEPFGIHVETELARFKTPQRREDINAEPLRDSFAYGHRSVDNATRQTASGTLPPPEGARFA